MNQDFNDNQGILLLFSLAGTRITETLGERIVVNFELRYL
jgi:hypothetical protein